MNKQDLGQATGFVGTMSLIFMMVYAFQMTKSPFFFLLTSVMSFGYMLCLLALFQETKNKKFFLYLIIGILLIVLCTALSFTIPHEQAFFN